MVSAKLEVIIPAMAETCLTKKEIAKEAGVSESVVYRIAKGYLVRPDMLGKVCKFLGIDIREAMILQERKEK